MRTKYLALVVLVTLLLPVGATHASASFADISTSYLYGTQINMMAKVGIVKGNPDGNFYPDRQLNRAEFAIMVARAMQYTPPHSNGGCFPDVKADQWYTDVICDFAGGKGVLTGYSDGLFHPERTVSRIEALVMMMRGLKIAAPEPSDTDTTLFGITDVTKTAWYGRYLASAYKKGIMPVSGQAGPKFFPGKELTRGEAAAYIASALTYSDPERLQASSSVSSTASSQGSSSQETARNSSSVASSASSIAFMNRTVSIPFTDTHATAKKNESMSYLFTLTEKRTVLSISAVVTGFYDSRIDCRLYKLETRDTPNQLTTSDTQNYETYEYYLGVTSLRRCDSLPALGPGKYQLEVIAAENSAMYQVDVTKVVGFGNDGFVDAIPLTPNAARSAFLDNGDIYDAYTFVVNKEGNFTVQVTGTDKVDGIIYEPRGVNDPSFTGPAINKTFTYQPATYTVLVVHKQPINQRSFYSISLIPNP